MGKYIYLFDLDSTITKQAIFPSIAKKAGVYEEMKQLTESTRKGEVPFKLSFLRRVDLLKHIVVSDVSEMIADIPCNEELVTFIQENMSRCYVITGNLDVWISGLLKKIGMERNVFCSKAIVDSEGYIQDVLSVIDKGAVISQMVSPFVAVGDGNNDAEMIEAADIGIGFGGVRTVADAVLGCATHVIYDERKLVSFLNKTLEEV